jgi:hypothetical protein
MAQATPEYLPSSGMVNGRSPMVTANQTKTARSGHHDGGRKADLMAGT